MDWLAALLSLLIGGLAPDLVKSLGDDDCYVRDLSQSVLSWMGAAAVPSVKKGLRSPDPEVRIRCSRLIALLERDPPLAWDELEAYGIIADKDEPHSEWFEWQFELRYQCWKVFTRWGLKGNGELEPWTDSRISTPEGMKHWSHWTMLDLQKLKRMAKDKAKK